MVGAATTNATEDEADQDDDDDANDSDDEDGGAETKHDGTANSHLPTFPTDMKANDQHVEGFSMDSNSCEVVWQGIVPKRIFTGFKFQVVFLSIENELLLVNVMLLKECKTDSAARKLLESKGVVHYWDMANAKPRPM